MKLQSFAVAIVITLTTTIWASIAEAQYNQDTILGDWELEWAGDLGTIAGTLTIRKDSAGRLNVAENFTTLPVAGGHGWQFVHFDGTTLTGRFYYPNLFTDSGGRYHAFELTMLNPNRLEGKSIWHGDRGTVVLTRVGSATGGEQEVEVTARFDASVLHFANELQRGGVNCDSPRVQGCSAYVNCDNSALDLAGDAIQYTELKTAARTAASAGLRMTAAIAGGLEIASVEIASELVATYLESETEEEFAQAMAEYAGGQAGSAVAPEGYQGIGNMWGSQVVAQFLPEPGTRDYTEETYNHSGCGELTVTSMLRRLGNSPRLRMTISAIGDCKYQFPLHRNTPDLGRWTVLGGVDVAPTVRGTVDGLEVIYSVSGPANYEVNAICRRSNPNG